MFASILLTALAQAAAAPSSDPAIPTPLSVLGKEPGSDFYLASYDESLTYFRALDAASDAITLRHVGRTTYGLEWYMALISSPQNLARLDAIIATSERLARAIDLDDTAARTLARTTPAVVHIDAGLHSNETACAQHVIPLAYELVAARGDATIDRIRNEVVLALWFSTNPDGQNMMAEWYRQNLGTSYETSPLPWLYQKYVGHDNNRDGYMLNTIESQVLTRTVHQLWPVVFYNHHQPAPFPARIWIPPFAEPVSGNVHPLMWRWVNVFGTQMAARLDEHEMPGAIHRGNGFDDWYPGFIDHVNSYKNTVSFLTETAATPYATPKYFEVSDFPSEKRGLRTESLYASPWKGGWWRLKDAMAYMHQASLSVLDTAARYRENLLYNRYQAGRDQIRRFREAPPYAYIVPAKQHDTSAARTLVGKLMQHGIVVDRATKPFRANGREYAAGDIVIRCDQAFGALVKELFEAQRYPEIKEGDKLDLPYDVAGWTLPLQFHVTAHALAQPPTPEMLANLETIDASPFAAGVAHGDGPRWKISRRQNAAARALNELFAAGAAVFATNDPFDCGGVAERGTLIVDNLPKQTFEPILAAAGIDAESIAELPPNLRGLKAPRIGVYHPWRASMDEGWTRWMLEEFAFPHTLVTNDEVLAGDLRAHYDSIVIADIGTDTIRDGFAIGAVPPRYVGGLGDAGVDELRRFVAAGGTLVTFNDAARFAVKAFALPVKDVGADLKQEDFFCSGSLLLTEIAAADHPLAAGMPPEPAIMFAGSPIFETQEGFAGKVILQFPKDRALLLSGFLRGGDKLAGKPALLEVPYKDGRVILFGFRPQWRGQPFGTFKLVFNSLFAAR
jgi:Zinc carboxypeptidase